MKTLTEEEFNNAPADVQYVYMAGITNTPIGYTMYNNCIEKYPEYFPDIVEQRRIWGKIPQQIKDQHDKELKEFTDNLYKDTPPSKGILHWADHPEELKLWDERMEPLRILEKEQKKILHDQYYAGYGLKFTE